jgi:hypothetical protein
MTRPPDRADSEVSVRASTGAGRLGRLVMVTMPVMRSVWPSRNPVSAYASVRGGRPGRIKDVRVSETMRLMEGRYQDTVGVWEEADGLIILKRTQLRSPDAFAAPCCTSYRMPSVVRPT